MREKLEVMEEKRREDEEEEQQGHHVNSVLAGDNDHWEGKHGRLEVPGEKGDRGLRGPPGMTSSLAQSRSSTVTAGLPRDVPVVRHLGWHLQVWL